MARVIVRFESGEAERVIEVDLTKAPFQHDGRPGSILDILLANGVPLEHACGGSCACTTCHVIVKGGANRLSSAEENEEDMLDKAPGLTPTSRLGCQAVIEDNDAVVEVLIPRYTINQISPGAMAEERTAILASVVDHGADTRSFFFTIPDGLVFRPGQFLSCLLPIGGERMIRPYSIASSPEESDRVELLLNLVPGGVGSRYLFGLEPGATLSFTGPWGTFVLDQAPDAPSVFVAIDTGIAPIRPMVRRTLASATGPVTLLYATTHPIYREELAALDGLRLERVDPGRVEEEVRRVYLDADSDRSRHFFVCGVGDVVPRLRDALRAGGYARRSVQYEKW